jgi:hypothetical protein
MVDEASAPATADEPSSGDDDTAPPLRRPPAVELAAALLIVTGAVQLVSAIGAVAANTVEPGMEGLVAIAIGLDVATIVAGVLVRSGRLWLLVVNYVAVLGFLDLSRVGAGPIGLMLAIVDLVVLYVLLTNRDWFRRRASEDGPRSADRPDD